MPIFLKINKIIKIKEIKRYPRILWSKIKKLIYRKVVETPSSNNTLKDKLYMLSSSSKKSMK